MKTKEITLTAVLIALLIVCSQIVIPIAPIPITLQTRAVLMIGYFLSPKNAWLATRLYLIMGVGSVPSLAGSSGGLHVLFALAVGCVIGFIPASYVQATYLDQQSNTQTKHLLISAILNTVFTYVIGLIYMTVIFDIYVGSQMNVIQI